MNRQEQQQLKGLFVATAMYFNHEIPDAALGLYVEDLVDLPFDQVAAAIREIRRDPKTTKCPLPAAIRARVTPESDPEADSVEAVGRIVHAVSRIGPYRTKDARAFIGELGWLVVQREGGWEQVCETLTDDNIGILKAQWRQMAMAQHKRARAGLVEAPALPSSDGKILPIDIKKLLPEMPR